MNENINLCEILKDCPKGTTFYSYNYGNVEFWGISQESTCPIMIRVRTKWGYLSIVSLTKEGFTSDKYSNLICTLVPSKNQPDWSKWQCPKPKKSKFDPETLKPFDKVIVRNKYGKWKCGLFSHFDDAESEYKWFCVGSEYIQIIPYNEETKHLVGTSDEAPEFYRYWED